MLRHKHIPTLAATCLILASSTVFAQRYPGNNDGKNGRVPRDRSVGGDRDEGTEYGAIVAIRAYGAQNSDKLGQISLRSQTGKQVSVHITDRTRYLLAGAEMDRDMVKALLVKDVPVTLQWRYSAETGGKVAYSIEVRTVSLSGTITKANKRQLTVSALPILPEQETEAVAPPIRAGGRKVTEPPVKKPAPKPKPKTLTLVLKEGFTRISLNGKKAEAITLKPKMTFDGVVVDGGPRWLIEVNANSTDGKSPTEPAGENDETKPEKPEKPEKGRKGSKPPPPVG